MSGLNRVLAEDAVAAVEFPPITESGELQSGRSTGLRR
jgi:hypothetical protein